MAPRSRAWADIRFGSTALVAGTDIFLDLLVSAPTVDTLTAVRIIGDFNVHYDVTTTIADSDSAVDVGIGVTSTQAFGVGLTALPDPTGTTTFPPRGWLYVATRHVAQLVTSSTGIINENAIFQFDIRAMRKIDKGILFVRIANTNLNIGGAMEVTGRIRTLCLT